jgi:hypothetical protein
MIYECKREASAIVSPPFYRCCYHGSAWPIDSTSLKVLGIAVAAIMRGISTNALKKHIVGESEHLSKSVLECFSSWFAEELTA